MNTSSYIIALCALLLFDVAWINMHKTMYGDLIMSVQGSAPVYYLPGAIVCYACIYALIILFVLPGFERDVNDGLCFWWAIGRVWLFGALVYAIYDFTSLTIYKSYTWQAAVMDALWGGTLFALVAVLAMPR